MVCKLLVALLALPLLLQGVLAQDKPAAPKGPPPRFITVRSVDLPKERVVFDVQVVAQNALDQPTLLVYADGHQRLTLGTKPTHVHLAEGFQVSLKKARWRGVDGKEMDTKMVARRLQPGVTVLLSADGSEVDPAYLQMFKADALVLVVPAEELPVPYSPHVGGGIPIKEVGQR
jgi:hypothetical protein